MKDTLDIINREDDYIKLDKEAWRTELGIRAITVMYDDHSSDKKSKENVFRLKDNITYRLFSTCYQYKVHLKELYASENTLSKLDQKNPNQITGFLMGNPHFEKIEAELSSLFDNIIFQMTSIFDYFSHFICYIIQTNKTDTTYWTKLARISRNLVKVNKSLPIHEKINILDNEIIGKLYDYRSRLIHNKRDKHQFSATHKLADDIFRVNILASPELLKTFKFFNTENDIMDVTLAFAASKLIYKAFDIIEQLLDSLEVEIKSVSNLSQNLRIPKEKSGFMLVSIDPKTRIIEPASEGLWKQYKLKQNNS